MNSPYRSSFNRTKGHRKTQFSIASISVEPTGGATTVINELDEKYLDKTINSK